MTEQLITFKTAKLAKLKQFNEPCRYISREGKSIDLLFDHIQIHTNTNSNCANNDYMIPTQALLQTWLRDKHQCLVIIDFYNNGDDWDETEFKVTVSEFKHFKTHDSFVKSGLTSYEDALELGLYEALKLL